MAQVPKSAAKRPKSKVRRYAPDRLLRRPVQQGGVTVSPERHKGRIVVRIESVDDGSSM